MAENAAAMGKAEESARRLRSASLAYGGSLHPATEQAVPEITEQDSRMSVLRNTRFALGHEMGGADWEGIKREGVGHDRETTIMGAALTAVSKLDTDVLPRVAAIETKGEEYRKQMKALEQAEQQGEAAVMSLKAHTLQMELEKRRKTTERVELEKDIVTWHLAQSEESESQTRRWLKGALDKAEGVIALQGEELATMNETHSEDMVEAKAEIEALKGEITSMNRTSKTMQQEMAQKWRDLRENDSNTRFDNETLQARLFKAEAELRLAQEDMAATNARHETQRGELDKMTTEKNTAVAAGLEARRELNDRLDYVHGMGWTSRTVEEQAMQIDSGNNTLERLQKEKVELAARLALADNEAAHVMKELVKEQNGNHDLRAEAAAAADALKKEKDESERLRQELTEAADDILNLQGELNMVLKVQAALRSENRELGQLNVKAVEYRQFMAPYDLVHFGSGDAWVARNDFLMGRHGSMEKLVKKYQNVKELYGDKK